MNIFFNYIVLSLLFFSTLSAADAPSKHTLTSTPTAQNTVPIPAGKAIIGDATSLDKINELPAKVVTISAFAIGTNEVTNAQYATWLNRALKDGKITYITEADNRGQILDMHGNLLCKTFTADPYSQITVQLQSLESSIFLSVPGKDDHPVINVTWYGAKAFCEHNGYRLPTEAEWEKAAGMEPEVAGVPLKKYRYGFGQNEIDITWANYKANNLPIQHFKVLTTPVGFYNGINLLSLSSSSQAQQRTHLARSPYGAFDMSGNVWEWVSDWYDSSYYKNMSDNDPQGPTSGVLKVVKGGCYDSLQDGVRVSERLGLLPDYCDAFTGFRVVLKP